MEEPSSSSTWTWEQDKAFENGLAVYMEDAADLWEKIAEAMPGKSAEDIKHHHELLMEDIKAIESGQVPLPCYVSSLDGSAEPSGDGTCDRKGRHTHRDSSHGGKASRSDPERRKGISWTEDEHRLFLLGLERYGKGDWRSISRKYVISRTPTQVASHAQKYFIRLNSMNKERRRSSIHDITSVGNNNNNNNNNNNGDISAPPQGPITGQTNGGAAAVSGGESGKQSPQQPAMGSASGVGVYGMATMMGQPPIGGPIVSSAVGTLLNLPLPSSPAHMAYGIRAPVPGTILPAAASMNLAHMAYPMPHTSAHR